MRAHPPCNPRSLSPERCCTRLHANPHSLCMRACRAHPPAACMSTRPCALCAVLHKLLAVLLWACGQHYRAALPAVSMWPAFSRAARPGASACTPCLSRARRRRQRRWDGVRSWRTGALVVRRPVIKKRLHPDPKGAPGCAPMRGPPDALRTPRDLCLTPRKIRNLRWTYNCPGSTVDLPTARDPPLTPKRRGSPDVPGGSPDDLPP